MPIIGIMASARTYGDFVLLGTVTATGSETDLTFDNISDSYSNLFVVASFRAASSVNGSGCVLRFNNDTGNNYMHTDLQGYRMGGSGARNSSISAPTSYIYHQIAPTSYNTANAFGSCVIDIPSYRASTFKHVIAYGGYMPTNPSVSYSYQTVMAGNWANTAPVTRIDFNFFGNTFVAGSTASLYGVK